MEGLGVFRKFFGGEGSCDRLSPTPNPAGLNP